MKSLKAVILVSMLLPFLGCQTKSEPEVSKNRQLVIEFVNSYMNMEDLDASVELLSPDFINYVPSDNYQGVKNSPEDMKNGRLRVEEVMPDLHFEIEEIISEDNQTVVIANGTFTHNDTTFTQLGMAPPTGKKISYKIVFMFEVKDGKIVQGFVLYDMFNRSKQMGMIPESK
jgi:predicted ester cyclase